MQEKEKKILHMGKVVTRITIGIGVLSIVLPILFWKQIPSQIPMHFGADGVIDRMGDKSELILLFFVILFLMGMMSIVIYYVKMNAMSQYAKEKEKTSLTTIYPMMLMMNFFLMCGFSYIIFCAVTVRNLGMLFLPIFLIATFAPVAYYLWKEGKIRREMEKQMEDYRTYEKTAEGEVYRAHVDWWLGLLLGGTLVSEAVIWLQNTVEKGKMDWFMFGVTAVCIVLVVPIFFIKYILYLEYILVSMPVYGKVRIPYKGIVNMKETHNPISSAAPSLDRIQIDYVVNGKYDSILISPVRKKIFIQKVEQKRVIWGTMEGKAGRF